MIFRDFSGKKLWYSVYLPELAIASLVLALAFAGSDRLAAVTVELGPEGETSSQTVETPNLASDNVALPAEPAAPVPLPDLAPGQDTTGGSVMGEFLARVNRGLVAAESLLAPVLGPSAPLSGVLESGSAPPVQVSGVGSEERTAIADGPAVIELLLRTYQPATMEVRLIDTDGTEVMFDGHSLLEWVRPNDTANAPVWFRGERKQDSLFEESSGNFSPRQDLTYSFDIKRGQKILLSTSGNALPESYLRVKSGVF